MKKKRVVQISLDIITGYDCNGTELADSVTNELERKGFTVAGAGFQEDLTELYEKMYPEVLREEKDL